MVNYKWNTLLLLVAFSVASYCNAQLQPNCTELKQNLSTFGRPPTENMGARIPCADLCTGEPIAEPSECNRTDYCIFLDENCYLKELSNALAAVQRIDLDMIGQQYFRIANGSGNGSQTGPRRLPGSRNPFTIEQIQELFPGVSLCQKFPDSCTVTYSSPNDIQPQLNIPYCKRIVCRPNNPFLEFDPAQCLNIPGCAFDYSLYVYRSVLGSAVLFNVPICHLAIRNDAFQRRANEYIEQGNVWNPILTDCLVEENKDEIFGESRECAMVRVIEDLGYHAKRAGWKGISSRDCHLINGCWMKDACVYPLRLTTIQVKANEKKTPSFNTVVYGRTECLPFGKDLINGRFLDAYNTCLQSGCATDIDSAAITQHLMGVARTYLPPPVQVLYKSLILSGSVQAHNWKEMADKLIENSILFPTNIPGVLPPPPESGLFPPGVRPNLPRGNEEGPSITPVFSFSPPCPYRNIQWPGFPLLQGSFDGCCDIASCYIPRNAIRDAHSEIASYLAEWTSWSPCSRTCGSADQIRRQVCVGSKCSDAKLETRKCNLQQCQIYSHWSEYSSCSATCGGGRRTRTRTCSNPKLCNQSLSESTPCRTGRCPSMRARHWSRCSTTCGIGMQTRRITCDRPGAYGCPPPRVETRKCETFCGGIRHVDSSCDMATCFITSTPQCVLRNGQPGHCRKRSQEMRIRTRKCFSGRCLCVHRPRRRQCRIG